MGNWSTGRKDDGERAQLLSVGEGKSDPGLFRSFLTEALLNGDWLREDKVVFASRANFTPSRPSVSSANHNSSPPSFT